MTLETYAREPAVPGEVRHKKHRTAHLGEHVTLSSRTSSPSVTKCRKCCARRIFEEEGIKEELACLQPARSGRPQSQGNHDDRVPDPDERGRQLAELIGIEDRAWIQVGRA